MSPDGSCCSASLVLCSQNISGPQEIQYSPATEDVYEADWLAADAYKRCPAKAIGNASEEEFRWAMSVRLSCLHWSRGSRCVGSRECSGGIRRLAHHWKS